MWRRSRRENGRKAALSCSKRSASTAWAKYRHGRVAYSASTLAKVNSARFQFPGSGAGWRGKIQPRDGRKRFRSTCAVTKWRRKRRIRLGQGA
ncbi:hypothetical protein PF005_g28483 [Phytophthora fragariae]|uniref:Uncharacterized protein n=1 Tax=Phytophthora fragariae TaxID=53985 RepID=A0A6A3QFD9_9STRA|nr:hypothetical protein PF003_g37302 [Phytophthora fragariae]KAE8878693.1 hypothetical protein PF003_g37307 [Phytophthora fragariae]KAE8971606.1 hypothetical protein PF011_g25972 [Phytophthora fragariae]KAE9074718.1 hypothetical protein PF006_g28482 [Phytophthora fragariae]KAE9168199.1 hypothetical protein PF005_g28483 [Phytophthora fragariae]